MFSLLKRFIEFVRQLKKEPEQRSITSLLFNSTWAVDARIELITDVIGWINGNMEEFLENGALEVNVIRGESLAEFIVNNQRRHKYLEILSRDLKAIRDGVVLVAMDSQGLIIKDQLILSKEGLSTKTIEQFRGEAIIKIKLQN